MAAPISANANAAKMIRIYHFKINNQLKLQSRRNQIIHDN